MSIDDELNAIFDKQDRQDDRCLRIIKGLVDRLAKNIEERKREREAKRKTINDAPSEFIEEIGPRFIQLETYDEERFESSLNSLEKSVINVNNLYSSTDGSISAYYSEAVNYIDTHSPGDFNWFGDARLLFDGIAEDERKRGINSERLDQIHPCLGERYNRALEDADRAKILIGSQHSGLMAMRDFLGTFWGWILDYGRQSKPSLWHDCQSSRHGSAVVRDRLANSLSRTPEVERKLVELLRNMSDLYKELSETNKGKDVAFDNMEYYKSRFTQWRLLISDILEMVFIDLE